MCRFMLYLGEPVSLAELITRPAHSIIHQSYTSRLRSHPTNGDGFGVAWYAPALSEEPALFRDVRPAWSNSNLNELCRVTVSGTVLAHVRAASPGLGVSEANCHPFKSGPFAFMHNGVVGDFLRIKRRLQSELSERSYEAIHGTTDSEHAFAMFLDRHEAAAEDDPTERLVAAVRKTILDLSALASTSPAAPATDLNIAVTDGRSAVVSRHSTVPVEAPSLFLTQGRGYTCSQGGCRVREPGELGDTVIVASEPLAENGSWDEVPTSSLVVVRPDRAVEIRPI